jgi:hypothetical protein
MGDMPVCVGSIPRLQPDGGFSEFARRVVDGRFDVWSSKKDDLAEDSDTRVLLRRMNVVDKLGHDYDEHNRCETLLAEGMVHVRRIVAERTRGNVSGYRSPARTSKREQQ